MRTVDTREWEIRCDLAAAYRLIAHFGMDDLIFTHLSARLPGKEHRFLLNPYGMMFDEITASSLVVVDPEGHAVEKAEVSEINSAGFTIHSAVHMNRHNAQCVMHTHTLAGMAVAAQDQGLLPLNQISMELFGRVAYHDFEGIADDLEERERLARDLGDKDAMILKHHGLLTVGRSVAEAFFNMYYLDQSCRIQIAATQGGQKVSLPPDEVVAHTMEQSNRYRESPTFASRTWAALKRRLDRISPGYGT
ncbi:MULTISPECIES: class II aldolase/adducin family protein [unclassified Bradyrhizobium]|uniref:class II aldolase/adducin family protein n=1 Tax=unclassified Bradyrhizobium TaxID=2631580 RepID=UPI001CD55377|nr:MULTISPECIES: class II aldolase/adducin family protein [unclassified Bradyrhizobium]MCA1386359.1 class II aldolase/adducin family protein [Bradyrhizobium sp. BRP05]MCA1394462.1 class II aldolase/adducin family protein [Bradyrhizobium sp. IC3123]MCA1423955.1 class II aldolase/adducin family protein [Bradyrhizobium sp. BRP23]MCA1431151.1 class II aldolase/adducin family protein [Bradyrhizobium sp. NBAIM16]MCA1480533.1 class II aldolase/adducin family protein [Bradyrhizobium sp. NBAIM08]